MFENKYTGYLLENRWMKINPMGFVSLDDKDLELFFDTSDQIDIYLKKKSIGSYYLKDLNHLIIILDTLR